MLDNDNPDIVFVTETWLNSSIDDSLITSGRPYEVFRKDRSTLGGGVCIILNNNKIKATHVSTSDEFSDLDILSVDILNSNQPVRLILCYRPPSSDSDSSALTSMKHYIDCLEHLSDTHKSVVLLGDFNLPQVDWSNPSFCADSEKCSTAFLAFTKLFAMEQLVTEPTRFDPTYIFGSILDLILCNDIFIIQDIHTDAPFCTSDHCTVCFNLLFNIHRMRDIDFTLPNFHRADWPSINLFLQNTDWLSIFSCCNTINDCCDAFYRVVSECINKNVPFHSSKPGQHRQRFRYPARIKKHLRQKKCLWRRLKVFQTTALKAKYRYLSNLCRSAIFHFVENFENNIIQSCNLGKFFRYSNSKFSHRSNVGPLKRDDGNLTMDPNDKAALLARVFSSLFTNVNVHERIDYSALAPSSLQSVVFTESAVCRTLKKLKIGSAGGPDGLPPIFLKMCSDRLSQPLTYLFQLLFDNSALPPVWLQAYISPIFKNGDSADPHNYRPVSLTCTLCKVMETVVKNQLVFSLVSRGLISRKQHAFLAKRSTITNLLDSLHDWTLELKCKRRVDVVYIDFSHAFDSVVHSKLLTKLHSHYGISGLLLQWIGAFLTGRSQCVVVEHAFSAWSPVISGVPQGSVLGPILFILFIDDVSSVCYGNVVHQVYADDVKLYSTLHSNSNEDSLQTSLHRLEAWCVEWQLNVNVSKCHVLHLGCNVNCNTSYTFAGHVILPEFKVRDLGVTIDSHLKFDAHIDNIVGRAYGRIGALFRGFATRSIPFLRQAYVTYVRPVLEYASQVWSPYLNKHINAIENVQRRFSKRIQAIRHLSYGERLAVLGLEPLELRRLKFDLITYYKILTNNFHLPPEYLPLQLQTSNTRSGGSRLTVNIHGSQCLLNNFFDRCVACWNSLPRNVIESRSVPSFRKSLSYVDLRAFVKCKFY